MELFEARYLSESLNNCKIDVVSSVFLRFHWTSIQIVNKLGCLQMTVHSIEMKVGMLNENV